MDAFAVEDASKHIESLELLNKGVEEDELQEYERIDEI